MKSYMVTRIFSFLGQKKTDDFGTCHSNYVIIPSLHSLIFLRFTRPENLGSESKIRCSKCRSYQVRNCPCPLVLAGRFRCLLVLAVCRLNPGGLAQNVVKLWLLFLLGINQEVDCEKTANCHLFSPQGNAA